MATVAHDSNFSPPDCKDKAPPRAPPLQPSNQSVIVRGFGMNKLGLLLLPALALIAQPLPSIAQEVDPSEVFLKAYMTAQQAEKLEHDNQFKPALSKFRFAGSLLEELKRTGAVALSLRWRMTGAPEPSAVKAAAALCSAHPGPTPLYIEWSDGNGEAVRLRARRVRVAAEEDLVRALRELLGTDSVHYVKAG